MTRTWRLQALHACSAGRDNAEISLSVIRPYYYSSFSLPLAIMVINPHKLGVHKLLKHIPLNAIFDAPSKARLRKAVNIADLRLCAKQRAHKVSVACSWVVCFDHCCALYSSFEQY